MAASKRFPSYLDCVRAALSSAASPQTFDELVSRVADMRPAVKSSRASVYRATEELYEAVRLEPYTQRFNGDTRIGWLSRMIQGSTVRHSLEREEVRGGYVRLDELEHALLVPHFFQDLTAEERPLTVELFGGDVVDAAVKSNRDVWSLEVGRPMVQWLDDQGAMSDDDLILHVVDAFEGRYALRLQPREVRDEDAIDARNRQLARAAEEIAVGLGREQESIYTWNLVARLLANGHYRELPAPDDLHYVLQEYSRLEMVSGMGYEVDIAGASLAAPSRPDTDAGTRARTRGRAVSASPARMGQRGGRNTPADIAKGRGQEMQAFEWGGSEEEDSCEAYEEYLEAFREEKRDGAPHSHDDFHLLAAELEALVDLELEFGYLMPDQNQRKTDLADRLFIDPESLVDGSWDEDGPDTFGTDSPAFWN